MSTWATKLIEDLAKGSTVQCRPRGHSMTGIVDNGDLVTIVPLDSDPRRGDVVLCVVGKAPFLHLVVGTRDGKYLIGNNRGKINGWVDRSNIHGRMIGREAKPPRR